MDADVHAVLRHRVTGAEVIELFELGADVGGGDHPVRRSAQRGPVDDVRDFEHLVEQRDVPVGEVDRGTGSGCEVVAGADGTCDDQVVDDFAVDFRNELIGHDVGQGAFGVNVMHGLEVLGRFEGPVGAQLAGHGAHRVGIDAHRDLWLHWVVFEIVLVVSPNGHRLASINEAPSGEGDRHRAGRMIEASRTGVDRHCRTSTAFTGLRVFNSAGAVEADLQAGVSIIAVATHWRGVDVDHDRTGQDGQVGESAGGGGTTTRDGEVFALDGLRRVVRVERPAVLPVIHGRRVLAHDLRSGNRLALAEGVAIADVENEAGRAAHGLDTDEVVSDEAREALAEQGEGEPGEVGDRAGRGCLFHQDAAVLGVHRGVLVLKHRRHEAVLARGDFQALAEDWRPLVDELVLLPFEEKHVLAVLSSFLSEDAGAGANGTLSGPLEACGLG